MKIARGRFLEGSSKSVVCRILLNQAVLKNCYPTTKNDIVRVLPARVDQLLRDIVEEVPTSVSKRSLQE